MDIRPTRADDWKQLRQLRLAALQDAPTAFGVSYAVAAGDSDERWRERASPGGTAFWLAVDGDRPVGMVGAVLEGGERLNLIALWVEPASRGCGAAARLVEAVKAWAVAQGIGQVFLEVAPDNARAVNLYLAQGFVFLDEWETLDSHPTVVVRTMAWTHETGVSERR